MAGFASSLGLIQHFHEQAGVAMEPCLSSSSRSGCSRSHPSNNCLPGARVPVATRFFEFLGNIFQSLTSSSKFTFKPVKPETCYYAMNRYDIEACGLTKMYCFGFADRVSKAAAFSHDHAWTKRFQDVCQAKGSTERRAIQGVGHGGNRGERGVV